uniref:histone acetyltransferase n=2 Tax=Homalodisca liturata TaxID=320908 RepID=A0A1B6HGK6_9HEMI
MLPMKTDKYVLLFLRQRMRRADLTMLPSTRLVNKSPNYFQCDLQQNDPAIENLKSGLVKGTSEADVERCIALLQHVGNCRDLTACQEGGACVRTKRVIFHYWVCRVTHEGRHCSICQQLLTLCKLHAQRCQDSKLGCDVLHCPNRKKSLLSSNNPSRDECKELFAKLMKALRSPSSEEEKMRHVKGLCMKHPQVTEGMLRVLQKMRQVRLGRSQVGRNPKHLTRPTPVRQVIRPTLFMPDAVKQLTRSIREMNSSDSLVSWKAKILFTPKY